MILITAATPWESRPIVRRLGMLPRGGIFEVRLGELSVALLETGIGAEKTLQALAGFDETIDLVVSSGFAGALQPGIASGDIVLDPYEAPVALLDHARAAAEFCGVALHMGRLCSSERVLCEPREKKLLGERERAAAVDMESSAIRGWAARRGVLFVGLRAVLDGMDQRLPFGVPASCAPADLASYALKRWRDLPLLLRLGFLQRRAGARLSELLLRLAVDGAFAITARECPRTHVAD